MIVIEQPLLGRHASAWDQLVDVAPLPSPFLRSWWLEHTSRGRPVFALVLDGDTLVGGVALQEEHHPGGTRLRFMGSGPLCPDHLDLLAATGREAEVVETLRAWLSDRDAAIVDLAGLRRETLVTGMLDVRTLVAEDVAPYLELPDDPAAVLEKCPSRVRNTIVRTQRRLAKVGVVHRLVAVDDRERALAAVSRLHELRWGARSPFLLSIHRFNAAAAAGIERGEVDIHELVVDPGSNEDVIASHIVLRVAGRASYYQAGRRTEPEWRGAGSVLLARSIEAACASGCREYDFLRGAESYKLDWATGERDVCRLVGSAVGRRPGASALAAAVVTRQRARPYVHQARALVVRGRMRLARASTTGGT